MGCSSRHCQLAWDWSRPSNMGKVTPAFAKRALREALECLEQGQMPNITELMSILNYVSDYTYVANTTESE